MKPLALVLTGQLFLAVAHAQIASVDWGAQISNGLGDVQGIELGLGDLVRIGTFNLTDTQIQDAQSNPSLLNASFVEYGAAAIGDDVGVPAHWNTETTRSTDLLGLAGRRIYLWAFDNSSMSAAMQQGIFTSSKPNWIFPEDTAIPNTTAIDLQDVQASGILVGGFGAGNSTATGAALFNLAVVPEPADYATCVGIFSLAVAVLLRRRRKPEPSASGEL